MTRKAPSSWRSLLPAAGMVVTSAVVGAATAEWWMVGLGALAGAALWASRRRPQLADELPGHLDEPHRARAQALLRTREQLLQELASVPAAARELLSVSDVQVKATVGSALRLVEKHQEVEAFLLGTDEGGARREKERLVQLAAQAKDPDASGKYQLAAQAREAQLLNLAELRATLSRLDAELTAALARLESVRAQLLRLKTASVSGSVEVDTRALRQTLDALGDELSVLVTSVEGIRMNERERS